MTRITLPMAPGSMARPWTVRIMRAVCSLMVTKLFLGTRMGSRRSLPSTASPARIGRRGLLPTRLATSRTAFRAIRSARRLSHSMSRSWITSPGTMRRRSAGTSIISMARPVNVARASGVPSAGATRWAVKRPVSGLCARPVTRSVGATSVGRYSRMAGLSSTSEIRPPTPRCLSASSAAPSSCRVSITTLARSMTAPSSRELGRQGTP